MERGVRWLLRQQAEDGGWHSTTYGNMRGGAGNTGLILAALSQPEVREAHDDLPAACARAVTFLTTRLDEQGLARPPKEIADYPVSATAYLLIAARQFPNLVPDKIVSRLYRGLLAAQRSRASAWPESHPDFGGWGLTANVAGDSGPVGPSNTSATAASLTALSMSQSLPEAARDDALTFLSHCQCRDAGSSDDGGFYFTPRADDSLNKAGVRFKEDGEILHPQPYLSPTCDGIVAFCACGRSRDDARLKSATTWLTQSLKRAEPPEAFRRGLRFYETLAMTRVARVLKTPEIVSAAQSGQQALARLQRKEGFWENDHVEMREDDPLIATALALFSLTAL